jgi:hypothetical protein
MSGFGKMMNDRKRRGMDQDKTLMDEDGELGCERDETGATNSSLCDV